jgi:hypothetical protein
MQTRSGGGDPFADLLFSAQLWLGGAWLLTI